MRALLLVVFCISSLVFGSVTLTANPLSGSELHRLFPGRFYAVVRGYGVHFVAMSSGRLVGDYKGLKDHGRWSIRSGRLCIMLKSWLSGQLRCGAVSRNGRWYRVAGVKFRKL